MRGRAKENFTQNRHNRINVDKINKLFDRMWCEAGKGNERERVVCVCVRSLILFKSPFKGMMMMQ